MSPSRPFILRPVATSLLMVAILLVGWLAFQFLPLSALPEVDYPTIQVQTFYPGASPDVMTTSVTAPLELQFGQMPGLNQMSSSSSAGASVITLQFSLDDQPRHRRAGSAGGDQRRRQSAAVGSAGAADLRQGQSGRRADPDPGAHLEDHAAAAGARTWPTRASRRRSRSFPASASSASAAASGRRCASRPICRALAAYGLNIDDLRTTIANANVNTPKGNFDGPTRAYTINANDQLQNRRRLPQPRHRLQERRAGAALGRGHGGATARRTPSSPPGRTSTPAVILNIQRQPGANVIDVVDSIKALLPQLQASLPAAIDVAVLTDRTTTIRASVARRRVRADAGRRAGGAGDLRLPAQRAAPPSSRACRCRCRSSAPSAPCICWASASTTCR